MPKELVVQLMPGSFAASTLSKTRLQEPDFQKDFANLGAKLRERLDADFTVFSPEATADNQLVVDAWLQKYEALFLMILVETFFEQFPGLRSKYQDQGQVADLARELLEMVREDLRRYALRRLVVHWSAKRYPDAVRIGEPEKEDARYLMPVFSRRDDRIIGRVTLTSSGDIVLDETTTGQQLRELLSRAA